MVTPPPVGDAMRRRRHLATLLVMLCAGTRVAHAEDYYTLIVSGASGGAEYAERHDRWRSTLVAALRRQDGFRDDHLLVLAETAGSGVGRASREGVRRAIGELREQMDDRSVLFVVLFGHGSYDGYEAKFNLVGPDLSAVDWAALIDPLPGRLVFVNTTAASFPFLAPLAGEGRVIITATESAVQRYDTVFPEFLTRAFEEPASDLDKNRRVSAWEAFSFASAEVRRWYQQEGRLATERPLLDDTGDGAGTEADADGPDGGLAARMYLGAGVDVVPLVSDPALAPLVARRAALEAQVAELGAAKPTMDAERYAAELERLLVELARVSRDIRRRIGARVPSQ